MAGGSEPQKPAPGPPRLPTREEWYGRPYTPEEEASFYDTSTRLVKDGFRETALCWEGLKGARAVPAGAERDAILLKVADHLTQLEWYGLRLMSMPELDTTRMAKDLGAELITSSATVSFEAKKLGLERQMPPPDAMEYPDVQTVPGWEDFQRSYCVWSEPFRRGAVEIARERCVAAAEGRLPRPDKFNLRNLWTKFLGENNVVQLTAAAAAAAAVAAAAAQQQQQQQQPDATAGWAVLPDDL